MSLCRACLCKDNLQTIFSDRNLISSWSTQLFLVTGVKIEPNDGLTQLICKNCLIEIKSALELRKKCLTTDETLRKTFKDIVKKEHEYISIEIKPITEYVQVDQDNVINAAEAPIQDREIKKAPEKKTETKCKKIKTKRHKPRMKRSVKTSSDYQFSVSIEDFESSNDELQNDNFNLGTDSDNVGLSVKIEDYESDNSLHLDSDLDSLSGDDQLKVADEFKINKTRNEQYEREIRERQLVEREKRKSLLKEKERKLMALAVAPYPKGGPIKCSLCDRTVSSVPSFKSHAKTHFELQNTCEECGKKFVGRSHMRYHQQRVHGRTKRLACSRCPYRAVDLQTLRNHERAEHTGERPYVCDVCGGSFRMRANIVQHMRKHFGVRNLQCDRCPAMFRSRSELWGHQTKVHIMTYTYLCYLCPQTYKWPGSVKKHLEKVHGVPTNQQLPVKSVKKRRSSLENTD